MIKKNWRLKYTPLFHWRATDRAQHKDASEKGAERTFLFLSFEFRYFFNSTYEVQCSLFWTALNLEF